MTRRPPTSPLFPSTPLFRSYHARRGRLRRAVSQQLLDEPRILGARAVHLPVPGNNRAAHERPRAAPGSCDRKSTRLNSSHSQISYAVFCLKKKKLKPFPPRRAIQFLLASRVGLTLRLVNGAASPRLLRLLQRWLVGRNLGSTV